MNNIHLNKYHLTKTIENLFLKTNIPQIRIGDSIKIKIKIQEGNKERIQNVEGVVISKKNSNLNSTITIRKVIHNVGVERIYLINSPRILDIQILKHAKVRRSKLYYLRQRFGKATRLKQRFV
uniref:Ribosomal protein L19 n=1 Tax=Wrangelia sp. TaxID=2575620 RepID=A0A4D6X2P6_9FLOR|nr:ribosomal protein L19 [Wrangelia sp.]